MVKSFILVTACIISLDLSAQLSGTAFLSGQTSHSGIKIKFLSNGGTAVTDSTTTDAAGNFSTSIIGGSYKVMYSKNGFLDLNYNGGTATILTNTVSLNSVTLTPGNQVNISGNVNGSWSNNNTYVVNGNLIIPNGQTLTIQPGTNVRFNGSYSITANGVLIANGNPSSPIIFTSNKPTPAVADWNGIVINSSGSIIKYCVLDYFQQGIWMYNSNPLIEHNDLSNFDGIAIYGQNSSANVNSNHIHDYNASIYSQGISWSSGTPTIACNVIHDGGGYGIRPYSGVVINNEIYNILGSTRGFGMEFSSGTATVQNNYIHNCNTAMEIGSNVTPMPNPLIVNNTISNNVQSGIILINYYANASIINNIITASNVGIDQSFPSACAPMCSTTPTIVSNNLVWNNANANYSGVQIAGIGQIVSTNSNGDAVDSYFNLSMDPLFSSGPILASNSPCFGAGKTAYSNNIGFNPSNGCNAGINSIKESALLNNLMSVYPNPSKGEIFVNINDLSTKYDFELHNALGQKVFETSTIETRIRLDLSGLPKGMYFLIAKENKSVVSNKKIVLE